MRLFKKDIDFLITQLNTPTLAEISQSSKYVNFQRGSKTALRKALKQANTQSELRSMFDYTKQLYQYQEMGFNGMIELYTSKQGSLGVGFRKAKYFAEQYGLPDRLILKFFETYESTLIAEVDSGKIDELVQEFLLEEFGDLSELSEYDE